MNYQIEDIFSQKCSSGAMRTCYFHKGPDLFRLSTNLNRKLHIAWRVSGFNKALAFYFWCYFWCLFVCVTGLCRFVCLYKTHDARKELMRMKSKGALLLLLCPSLVFLLQCQALEIRLIFRQTLCQHLKAPKFYVCYTSLMTGHKGKEHSPKGKNHLRGSSITQ